MKQPSTLTETAVRAMHEAVAKVVEDHRRTGRPLAVWRDGKAVWIPVGAAAAVHDSTTAYGRKSSKPRS